MRLLARLLPVACAAAALGMVAACGDSDSDSASKDGLRGDGSDASYVQLFCTEWRVFNDEAQAIIRKATNPTTGGQAASQQETEKLIAVPTGKLAANLKTIRTPDDVRAWHEATAGQFAKVSDDYKNGRVPSPPSEATNLSPAIAARLQVIAATNSDCRLYGSPFQQR